MREYHWDTVEEGKLYEVTDPERENKTIVYRVIEWVPADRELWVQRVQEFPIEQVDHAFAETHRIIGEVLEGGGRRTPRNRGGKSKSKKCRGKRKVRRTQRK